MVLQYHPSAHVLMNKLKCFYVELKNVSQSYGVHKAHHMPSNVAAFHQRMNPSR